MWRNRNVSRISTERLPSAARTRESRVAHPSGRQIAGRTDRHTERLQSLHNTTDVDTAKRAIRAIEIEEYYAHTPVDERSFPQMNSLIIGVDIDRELRREKITRRLHQRLEEGMIDEVRRLIEQGIQPDDLIYYGLEYKYLTLYVIGKLTYEEMFTQLETAIHQFAKRQMTWFRGMERRGFTIHWMNARWPMEEKIAFVKKKLEG